ncbi:MAG: cell division protein FtsH, partial [Thermoplasmata archaeon]
VIDSEIKRIVEEAYQQAKKLLEENIDKLKILAQALLQQEILDAEEVRRIVGIEKNTEDADIQDRKPS